MTDAFPIEEINEEPFEVKTEPDEIIVGGIDLVPDEVEPED